MRSAMLLFLTVAGATAAAALTAPAPGSGGRHDLAGVRAGGERHDPDSTRGKLDLANPNCTASSCPFYYTCDESSDLSCCADGSHGPGCYMQCPDTHCGQVDAAPSIPKAMFQPENADKLALYIAFTSDIQPQDPFCNDGSGGQATVTPGTCASVGYKYTHANEPGRKVTWGGYPHGVNPDFGPSTVFQKACIDGCGCCPSLAMLYNPGRIPACTAGLLPTCRDAPSPSHPAPLAHEWCGVCGPTLNAPRFIDFYFAHKIQSVCDPRNTADPSPVCAAAQTRETCVDHPLKCVWRAPTQSGACEVQGCCSIYSNGPTCNWDCASCKMSPDGVPGVAKQDFDMCCDGCEFCSATGNGTLATEATCGKPQDIRVTCGWKNTTNGQ